MSTRGTFGFKRTADELNRDDVFVVYSGSDSYYSGLGLEMLQMYLSLSQEQLINIFNNIDWTDQDLDDSDYQYDSELSHIFNPDRKRVTLLNKNEFFNNGLFCEYSYLYNLETDCLEIYKGFFRKPQSPELEKNGYIQKYNGETVGVYHTQKVLEINRENYISKILDRLDALLEKFGEEESIGKYHDYKALELNREEYMSKILYKLDGLETELDDKDWDWLTNIRK